MHIPIEIPTVNSDKNGFEISSRVLVVMSMKIAHGSMKSAQTTTTVRFKSLEV